MASSNGWKNPSDIMKSHLMQRNSSFSLTKTKSVSKTGFSRRHSFTILSQKSDKSPLPQLWNSQCDTSIHAQSVGSLKRKNPFECDSTLSNPSKRRTVLDQSTTSDSQITPSVSDVVAVPCHTSTNQTNSDRAANSAVESKQHRLLFALSLQEQTTNDCKMVLQNSQTSMDRNDVDMPVTGKQPAEVLREKSTTLNIEVLGEEIKSEHMKVCSSPPLDWSLKSKARVTAHSCVGSFKKYLGIDTRNVDSFVHHKLDNSHEWTELDILQQIKRCCMHYSYPHMPWLSTFPRLSSDFKSRSASIIAGSKDILDSLQKDWSNTFTAIYQQLRGGLCPYFYVCTNQFSILFRCLRSPNSTSWSALLSPSTRGFREMLTKEGIDFRMPNIRCTKSETSKKYKESEIVSQNESNTMLTTSQTDQNASDNAEDENSQKENNPRNVKEKLLIADKVDSSDDENEIDGDDDASQWLEGMGFDKKDFPSLEPFKVKLQREGFREIDNRPQSLVYVEGADVHSFFNFLLNYPSCIASSGPQHGIPPTILAPIPFVGGRLVQNLVKHTTLTRDGLSNSISQLGCSRNTHIFEISGPILPHHTLNIASILHNSPDCESSSVSCNTHSPSAAFNTQTENSTEKDKLAEGLSKLFVDLSQANPGLLQDVKNQLLASQVLDTGTAVRELHVLKSGYSWT